MENAVYLVQKYANFGVHYLVYHKEISHMCFLFWFVFFKNRCFQIFT